MREKRHKQILEILHRGEPASVRDLSLQMGVSESTIRRDLEELQGQYLIQRVHGGAVMDSVSDSELPFEMRQITNEEDKDAVGRIAASTVEDGDVIFIDGGTTTAFIVPYLTRYRDITVVTCALNICNALTRFPHIQTIVIGGELHHESQSITGTIALETLRMYNIHFNRSFIGAGGVSAQHGATNRIIDRISLKRSAMETSDHVVLVADASKIGVVTMGNIAALSRFQTLVTNPHANAEELAAIANLGVMIQTQERVFS